LHPFPTRLSSDLRMIQRSILVIHSDAAFAKMPDLPRGTRLAVAAPMSWRGNRPEEDPDKIKRWGWVTAKPSEHLVHVRRGRVLPSSGQGASCFKWPRDAIAIVPTSLQKLSFKADQVTVERVGVEVVGLAVYRV